MIPFVQGDDGKKFCHKLDAGLGQAYGPTYGKNDVVGCGWDTATGNVFFTKNGRNLGNAYTKAFNKFCPCVGIHSYGAKIHVNFGQKPFKFNADNFTTYNVKERLKRSVARAISFGICTFR